jgi:hypothetical protein
MPTLPWQSLPPLCRSILLRAKGLNCMVGIDPTQDATPIVAPSKRHHVLLGDSDYCHVVTIPLYLEFLIASSMYST